MKILYIEDENSKAIKVEKYVYKIISDCKIRVRKSYTAGIIEIQNESFDLILLDMSLPLYDFQSGELEEADDFEVFAGIDIMEEMKRTGNYTKVIVVTAFDELGEDKNRISIKQLDANLAKEFPELYLGIIHYDDSSLEWNNKLLKLIEKNFNLPLGGTNEDFNC